MPAFFLHGSDDEFVTPENSKKNHAAYGGAAKTLKMVPGDHNAERPAEAISEICQFFKANL